MRVVLHSLKIFEEFLNGIEGDWKIEERGVSSWVTSTDFEN